MKTVVLGDIHGRTCWKEIVEKEKDAEKIVFLGDYVSTHYFIPASHQLTNLDEILDYKERDKDRVVLLRGNHDTQHLGYEWGRCSGFDYNVARGMPKERYLSLTQWAYIDDVTKTLYTHAGVSTVWMELHGIKDVHDINALPPSEMFGFSLVDYPADNIGTSPTQPLTWIRPDTLLEHGVPGWRQIVGHTPQERLNSRKTVNGDEAWFCDTLEQREYLVIDGDTYDVRQLPEPSDERDKRR